MRKRYSLMTAICILLSAASMSLAYLLAGYWLILPVLLALALFWFRFRRWAIFRTSSALLSIFICLAAIGLTMELSLPLILIASTAALASWDLLNFEQALSDDWRLDRYHLQSLAIATSTGLVFAFLSSSLTLHIPFGLTLLLALVVIGCLTYGVQSVTKP